MHGIRARYALFEASVKLLRPLLLRRSLTGNPQPRTRQHHEARDHLVKPAASPVKVSRTGIDVDPYR